MEVSGVKLHHCHSQEVPFVFSRSWWKESGFQKQKKWPTKSSTRCRSFRFFGRFFLLTSSTSCLLCSSVVICLSKKQSAKRSGQEGATKRQRRVIQLSLGSNEALFFGGYSLGSAAMTVVARNLSPDVSIVILKPFAKKISWLKAC